MFVQNFMEIHPVAVEMFWFGPKWWADRLTDRHCHPSSHAASMAKKTTHSHEHTITLEKIKQTASRATLGTLIQQSIDRIRLFSWFFQSFSQVESWPPTPHRHHMSLHHPSLHLCYVVSEAQRQLQSPSPTTGFVTLSPLASIVSRKKGFSECNSCLRRAGIRTIPQSLRVRMTKRLRL